MRTAALIGAAAFVLALAGERPAAAQPAPDADRAFSPIFAPDDSGEPVAFAGDRFRWDRNTNVITGEGHVQIEQGERTLEADRVRLYLDRDVAELEGNVVVSQAGASVSGEAATYDLEAQAGTFEKPRTFSDPWYVSADEIVGEDETTYRARRSRITTCDLVPPHWAIGIGDLEIDEESGRATGRNVIGRAGPVPIFYLPLYSQRLDRNRPPIEYDVGYQSDVGGFVRLGFPLDVWDTVELQPQVDVFTKSGVGGGLAAEGTLFAHTDFSTDLWYLEDQNEDNTEERGITPQRHKFDWYSRSRLPDDWVALAQLEWLADREVLQTFFWDEFREREEPESFIDLTRTKPHTVLEVTVEKRLDDFTLARDDLPLVQADLLEYRLWDTPVFVSASADFAYSELKPEDEHLTFARHEARFSAPYRVARWLNAVPFAEVEGRYHDAGNLGTRDSDYDVWVRPGLTLQNRFHASFPSPLKRYERMRHLVEPTVTYAWRNAGTPDPEDVAFFDPSELSLDENRIELELRNKIQGRRPNGTVDDVIDYRVTLHTEFDDGTDHLAEVENELIVRPANRWVLSAQSVHDLRRESRAAQVNARIRYTDPRGISAFVGTVYTDARGTPWRSEIIYGGAAPLNPDWRVGFEHRLLVDTGELDQQEYWVWRRFHCWEVGFSVRDRRESITFMLQLGLTAFPERNMRKFRDESVLEDCEDHAAHSLFGNDRPARAHAGETLPADADAPFLEDAAG